LANGLAMSSAGFLARHVQPTTNGLYFQLYISTRIASIRCWGQ